LLAFKHAITEGRLVVVWLASKFEADQIPSDSPSDATSSAAKNMVRCPDKVGR
jgi:hypothetical protein